MKNLKTIRKYHQLSQKALADQLGVTQASIAMVEKTGRCTIEKAISISMIFDVSLDALCGIASLPDEYIDYENRSMNK